MHVANLSIYICSFFFMIYLSKSELNVKVDLDRAKKV